MNWVLNARSSRYILSAVFIFSLCFYDLASPTGAFASEDEPMTEQLDAGDRRRPRRPSPLKISSIVFGTGNQLSDLDNARATFFRGSQSLGYLDLEGNYPEFSGNVPANTNPLSVEITASDSGTVYGQTVQVVGFNDSQQPIEITVCLPRVNVGPGTHTRRYYFDVYGTAYFDPGRSRQVGSMTCPDRVDKAFKPLELDSGSINAFSTLDFAEARFFRGWDMLGILNLRTGGYTGASQPADTTGHALSMKLSADSDGTIPAHTLQFGVNGNGSIKTLCVPATDITQFADAAYYFFDNEGNAYYDAALSSQVIQASCPSLLDRGMRLLYLGDAWQSTDYPIAGASIEFYRGNYHLGTLDLETGIYQYNEVIPLEDNGKHPLKAIVRADGPVSLPKNTLNIYGVSDDPQWVTRSYCFPRRSLQDGQRATYYFDRYGTPYSDALLTSRVECSRPHRTRYTPTVTP